MNPSFFLYNLIGTGVGIALGPALRLFFRKKSRELERFDQRMGRYPKTMRLNSGDQPRAWLHAVSVGEVGAAAAVVNKLQGLRPDCHVMVSCTTHQGLARAREQFGDRVICFYAPFDLPSTVDRALSMMRPDLLVFLETEIWPNWIVRASHRGVRIAIINGRISVRSIDSYRKIKPLIRYTLSHVDFFSMISIADAARIESLGADRRRIRINGNAKFDSPDPQAGGMRAKQWARTLFNLADRQPVFVAGSTRHPEERIILDAHFRILQVYPDALLIIAPRHIDRIAEIEGWISSSGLSYQRRTELDSEHCKRTAPVVLLDTIGELLATYSIATFVFCGGSLVPKGGQNVLEPAMWSKPIMHGPSMEDFADAQQLIDKAGGGVTVHHAGEMADIALGWINDPSTAGAAGSAARRVILSHRGAAGKHAAVIAELMGTR